jgi:hypothetical protein
MRKISYIGFWLISLTWGCIMTFIGLIVAAFLYLSGSKPKRIGPNIYFVVGKNWGGVELGPIFLVSESSGRHTVCHECGHGIQNCIWGPLMPFVVCIPSAVRYWYRVILFRVNRDKYYKLPDYDSVWFEGQATAWGEKVYGNLYDQKQ